MKTKLFFPLFAIAVLVTELAFAQPVLPSDPAQAPIDGGLGLLAAAGGAYALKKLRDKNKDKNDSIPGN
ncbi:MAG: hypothetical protein MI700_04185 [Balneolales bacterium]|nr:hypothetical protein [Balneolales bacterium]